jgi:hypothetical protein
MNNLNGYMSEYQVKWRKDHIATQEWGLWMGKPYPWILPYRLWEEGLWPGIRSSSACSLPAYVHDHRIHMHSGVHNLKSSWVLCANLYFPFGASEQGRSLLAGFLRENLCDTIRSVEGVELEYAGSGALHPSALLGELGGSQGAGQTSPDVAFLVNGERGLVLTEVKFVEHSFYPCSGHSQQARLGREVNPKPHRCDDALAVLEGYKSLCHQVTWGRKYWDHLAPVIDRERMSSLHCCPAARTGYQLFRQQALAGGIAGSSRYDPVISCVAMDERDDTLQHCLRSTGISDVRDWGKLFRDKARFALFSHKQWVAWVRAHNVGGDWADWLSYVESRYGYTP